MKKHIFYLVFLITLPLRSEEWNELSYYDLKKESFELSVTEIDPPIIYHKGQWESGDKSKIKDLLKIIDVRLNKKHYDLDEWVFYHSDEFMNNISNLTPEYYQALQEAEKESYYPNMKYISVFMVVKVRQEDREYAKVYIHNDSTAPFIETSTSDYLEKASKSYWFFENINDHWVIQTVASASYQNFVSDLTSHKLNFIKEMMNEKYVYKSKIHNTLIPFDPEKKQMMDFLEDIAP